MDEFQSFTLKLDNIAQELLTPVGICDAVCTDIINTSDPRVLKMRALWDTGATNCVITPSCAKRLGVKPVGVVQTRHAGGESMANVYLVNIILPNNIYIPGVKVTECSEQAGSFDVIIGMNVITAGDFVITNIDKKTTFSFRVPSKQTIDFVEEHRIEDHKNGKVDNLSLKIKCPKCGKMHDVIAYYGISLEELDNINIKRSANMNNDILKCDHCKWDIDLRNDKSILEKQLHQKLYF